MGYNVTDSTAPPCKRFSLDAHQVALSEVSPRLLAGAFFLLSHRSNIPRPQAAEPAREGTLSHTWESEHAPRSPVSGAR